MGLFEIMSLIGGGANLLGNLFGPEEVMPEQINPLTDQYYQDIQNELGRWNQQQAGSMADVDRYSGRAGRAASNIGQLTDQAGMVSRPGALDWFDDFMEQQVPGYLDQAQQAAEMATRGGAEAQRQRANRMSEEAGRQVASQLGAGGMFSGGGQRAVAEGIGNVKADYEAQLGDQYQNAFMNAYTPLAGAGQQLGAQGQQNEFMNAMNQLSQMMSGQQAMGGIYGQQAGNALGQAQLYGSRAQGAEGARHDVAQPFYATPTDKPNALTNFGTNLSSIGQLGGAFTDFDKWFAGQNKSGENVVNELKSKNLYGQLDNSWVDLESSWG